MSDETPALPEIRTLDANTVARIAAGEVVERPASAVKELVENSLDADASRIDVTIEAGGTELIRVADDGHGMTEADLEKALDQHTTSKITDLADLESGVATLGFRGEALHTIGSVSKLTIDSRPRTDTLDGEAASAGTRLVYEGGTITSLEPTGCPEGTSVEVTELFANTPARRKFLKTTATEFAHVNRIVTRYALANPDVAVSLTHDGREVFATTGQGDLQAAVLAVYGGEVARAMITLEASATTAATDDADLPAGPLESVSGLVSHPETNRSSREYLATYVNGRAVTSTAIREGITAAYDGQLGDGRYPFVVCFLDAPGDAVDVNVHPRKREVRFDDDDAVRRQVEAAVTGALLEHGLVRSRAPRGRSAPDEATVEPTTARTQAADRRGDEGSGSEDDAAAERVATAGTDTAVDDGSTADDDSTTNDDSTAAAASATDDSSDAKAAADSGADATAATDTTAAADATTATDAASSPESTGESGSTPLADSADEGDHSSTGNAGSSSEGDHPGTGNGRSSTGDGHSSDHGTDGSSRRSKTEPTGSAPAVRKFADATEQRTLEGDAATADRTFDSLPPLRVLGQLQDTYLVCETTDGLALIDQHAADERVNYERLRDAFADDATAQALASPVDLELTAVEAEAFESYREALSRLGFYADRVDDRTVSVTTVPAVLEKTLEPDRLRDVLASFVEGDREAGAETVDALADEFLGDLACYPSITGNTSLTEGSVVDLLAALDDCENPYACPHGRPVIVSIDGDEIDDRFERDYPGHGG